MALRIFAGHPPAEIDRHEVEPARAAPLSNLRKDEAVQAIPFRVHVLERGGDEYADAIQAHDRLPGGIINDCFLIPSMIAWIQIPSLAS